MATQLQHLNIADVYRNAESIKGAQTENRLLQLTMPYRERALARDEQSAVSEQNDAMLKRNGAAARMALSVMGADFDKLSPEEQQTRFASARQLAADMGVDVSRIPQQYSLEIHKGIQALASQYGGTQAGNVQSTYIDSDGNRIAIMRDGSTRVLGKAEDSFQYTNEGLAFSRRGGTVQVPGQGGAAIAPGAAPPQASGADLIEQKRRQQAALDAEAAAAKARAEAGARADVERQSEQQDKMIGSQQTLDDLSRMDELARAGVYTGGLLDRAGNFLARAGAPVDQATANRTSQIMQLAQQLKFGVKPSGMGAMSDSEWGIIRDAIPDPGSSGNVEQLLAGIQEARRRIEQWRDRQQGAPKPAPAGGIKFMGFE